MAPRPLERDAEATSPRSLRIVRAGFGLLRTRAQGDPASLAEPATLPLGRATLKIEDNLLMVFGPEGDPIPPAEFARAAAAQPEAQLALPGGRMVPAFRVAAVLEAQARGPLTAAASGGESRGDAWLEAMLGIGPQPDLVSEVELLMERSPCELTAFGRELLITIPSGRSFLIADAGATHSGDTALGLFLPDDRPISVAELIGRLRSQVESPTCKGPPDSGAEHPFAEVALPSCTVQVLDAGMRFELPCVGAVRLASMGGGARIGPRVSIFLPDGEVATMTGLVAAFVGEPKELQVASTAPADRVPGAAAAGSSSRAPKLPAALAVSADGTLDLGFLARALDPDQERVVSATLAGVPKGARLSAGFDHGDQSWSLTADPCSEPIS
jgi:hypothetical protein